MGKYQDAYNQAEKSGTTQEVTQEIKTWLDTGDQLIGKVVEIKPFENGKFDTKVQQYILDTDIGMVSTVLGAATDKYINQIDVLNKIVSITFLGKIALDNGRQCNKFKVEIIPNA